MATRKTPPLSPKNPGRMMRVPEVAETLGVSRATVVRLIDSGELVATDVGSQSVPAPRRNWRVSEYHLVQFTNRRLV